MTPKQNYFQRLLIGVFFILLITLKVAGMALWLAFYLLMAACEFILIAIGWYNDLSGIAVEKKDAWINAIMKPAIFLPEYLELNGKRNNSDEHPN